MSTTTEETTEQAVTGLDGQNEASDAETSEPKKTYVMEVLPENIIVDPELKSLRVWRQGTTIQELKISELARLIYEEGQKVPCLCRVTNDGFVLVYGHRRKAAVELLREQGHNVQLRIEVDEEMNEHQAFRAALVENIQHEQFTPIEMANIYKLTRKRFGWTTAKSTPELAGFVGVSPATVSNTEKLLTLPLNLQDDIQMGRISASAALEVASVNAGKQQEVLKKAGELAEEDADAKELKKRLAAEEKEAKKAAKGTGKAAPVPADIARRTAELRASIQRDKEKAAAAAEEKGETVAAPKVTGTHVRQAAKQVAGATNKQRAPRMKEAIDLIETWMGPVYPQVMQDFAEVFVKWGHGKLGVNADAKLTAAWDDVADKVIKTVPQREVKQIEKATKEAEEAEAARIAEEKEAAKLKRERERKKAAKEAAALKQAEADAKKAEKDAKKAAADKAKAEAAATKITDKATKAEKIDKK